MRQAQVLLSPSALSHNLHRVKQLAPYSKVVSMIKANAYGHGVAFALAALSESDAYGVACMQEALEIRALGCDKPITLIEGAFDAQEWQLAIQHNLECVVHHEQQVNWALENPAEYQQKGLKLWLKINTGMNRIGFTPEQAYKAALHLRQAGFKLVLTMHFANADEPEHPLNQQQINAFLALKANLEPIEASCCNSAAIFNWPELHFDYVRPGIMLYGSTPFANQTAQSLDLQAVMTLKSHIIAIHDISEGQSIGYGSTYATTRKTRVGIVAMGYGDGYPRAVKNAVVSIRGQLTPLLGRVSMDMLAVDLSDLPTDVDINETVILWGDTPSVDVIAAANNTIGYELLCKVTNRPERFIQQEHNLS